MNECCKVLHVCEFSVLHRIGIVQSLSGYNEILLFYKRRKTNWIIGFVPYIYRLTHLVSEAVCERVDHLSIRHGIVFVN